MYCLKDGQTVRVCSNLDLRPDLVEQPYLIGQLHLACKPNLFLHIF
jgi:hypothetical protein